MRFQPKSEAEAQGLFDKGIYPGTVTKAEEKTSKSGNEMIALDLKFFRDDGAEVEVKDWLVSSEKCIGKIRHFCASAGVMDLYEAGELNADVCYGQNIHALLVVEEDDFGSKNKVADYKGNPHEAPIPTAAPKLQGTPGGQQQAARAVAEANGDDSIPF